ncbi:hypothetical protein MTR_3g112110 [Medicago truncatula]|uniref:Replication protein A 70 kDa DNA-binding subunit B/D first OB fold domain-containing protein n=1 Tax=Medicago truncatula TaxID=3880 RepID=A0A072V491_MEDTR|nr:hypothetical protein MTR_3g112110 [Medicago truncatula]
MSRDYDYIKDLKNDLDIWKIGFGVLDSWIVTGSNENQHLKLIVCDAEGDRVHVITRYRELEHWKALIKENKTYTLYNCHVFDNDIAFNSFKVIFGSKVIGLLHEIVKTTPIGTGKKLCTNIVLKDKSGNIVDVTTMKNTWVDSGSISAKKV